MLTFPLKPIPSTSSCKKSTLPWRPLLSYHSDAATHDRDMIGASYHRQATQLRCSDDLFDTIIVVSPQGYVEDSASADASSKSIATYVHRIINIRLLWRWHRTFYSIYMYSRHWYPLLGNLDPSIHPV